jgi:RND family efflux transporter MFP subunit
MNKLSFLKKKKYIALISVILLVVIFVLYKAFSPPSYPADKTYVVQKKTITNALSLSGTIDAEEKADMQFQTGGMLVWVGVKEGDRIAKGQAVASLDQRLLKKQFEKTLNTYNKSRNTFDQTSEDNKNYVLEKPEVGDALKRLIQNAQFDLNNSVLDVELQNLSAQYSNLTSPIAGIVTRVDAPNAGVNVTPASTFEVINPDTIYFSALVDQTDVGSISEGKEAIISLDSFPDKTFHGTIKSISFTPKSGETGTVYETKVTFMDGDVSQFRMGMTGDATVTLSEKKNALVIPLRFIKTTGDNDFVQKKEGNSVKQVKIQTGDETDGNIEVTSGLKEGDTIYEFSK